MKLGLFGLVALLLTVVFLMSNKFDKMDNRFDKVENTLGYIKESMDEHTFYDSSRISILESVSTTKTICESNGIMHFVQFKHDDQVLSGGVTVAHHDCHGGHPPDLPLLVCEDLDISIFPACPPKGNYFLHCY